MTYDLTGILAHLTPSARQGSACAHLPPGFRSAGAPGGLELTACPGRAVPAHPVSPELGPACKHHRTACGANVNGVQHRCYAFVPCAPRPVCEPSASQPAELQQCSWCVSLDVYMNHAPQCSWHPLDRQLQRGSARTHAESRTLRRTEGLESVSVNPTPDSSSSCSWRRFAMESRLLSGKFLQAVEPRQFRTY